MDFHSSEPSPVISDLSKFDRNSGSLVERTLFNNRWIVLAVCACITLLLGIEATQIKFNASFNKMIPVNQPFIRNFLHHFEELQSQGNAITIVVTANKGNVISKSYLKTLQKVNDEVYLLRGSDRPRITSLWTPSTTWLEITPDGLASGPVIDSSTYNGSDSQLELVRQNIQKAGLVGKMVSGDLSSSMIYVPLMEKDNITGKSLNYGQLSRSLNQIRKEFSSQGVTLHIIGFALVLGDMINGLTKILAFFAVSVAMTTLALLWYTRCFRSTALVVAASLTAVVWQMGSIPLLGFDLNPYSVLIPFLVFAIGMSHGAQKMNGVMQDIGRGTHSLVAARYTFRRLFLAGFAALTCDVASFAVLMTIQIQAIRELALIACIGVAVLIVTNLIMLPVILSYTGVSKRAALRSLASNGASAADRAPHRLWSWLDHFTRRTYASIVVLIAIALGFGGWFVGRDVQVGDLDQGAPELRQGSTYNRDNAYILAHYSLGTDALVVLVDTPPGQCNKFEVVSVINNLEWRLRQMKEVQSTASIGSFSEMTTMLFAENAPKWYALLANQKSLDDLSFYIPRSLSNVDCSFLPLYVSLRDHKAATLTAIVDVVQAFIADPQNKSAMFKLSLAGGNAGIAAATNIVIRQANDQMLYLVYASVIIFCGFAFRSWRAVLCAVLPLVLTSLLGQALMVILGIGIKVATLPVIALGVGVGVDYALYVLSVILKEMRGGASLSLAYHRTLLFTGRVVLLTGFTLAAGVGTWAFAPIKFQADMGLLLAFMFLWNMLGALILLPALAHFLLPERIFNAVSVGVSA